MGKIKIIVVDDEAIVLDSCRRVLEAEGFEVFLAASVGEAIRVIEGQAFSTPLLRLLLLDVKMPVPDGMHLLKNVNEQWPGLPVIVMSGYPTTETLKVAKDLGAVAFIAKPFTPDELLEAVKAVIQEGERH